MINVAEESVRNRQWSIYEARVLAAIYFTSNFSIGDDARDECRAIADSFGRTPASIDRQWRNLDAVARGTAAKLNVGEVIKQAARDYLANPVASRKLALLHCEELDWPLKDLVSGSGESRPLVDLANDGEEDVLKRLMIAFCDRLEFKLFSSGSQGFYRQGKLVVDTGRRFQSQVTAVLIGSKNNPLAKVDASSEELSFALRPIIDAIEPKVFRTGRVGFYASGKATVGQERFQVAIQAVEISGATA